MMMLDGNTEVWGCTVAGRRDRFTWSAIASTVTVAMIVSACSGSISTDGGRSDASDDNGSGGSAGTAEPAGGQGGFVEGPAAFICGDEPRPAAVLKKLTMVQVNNSVRDLIRVGVKSDFTADTIWKSLATLVAGIPADQQPATEVDLHGSFARLDQVTQQGQIEAIYDLALKIGVEMSRPDRLGTVLGTCATDTNAANDNECLDDFIRSFGERVLRHPLQADELARFRTIHAAANPTGRFDQSALANVVGAMFLSPYFLTFVEHGEDAVAGNPNVRGLSAHELASELSLHLWETVPDDTLWKAARSGALLTEEGYAAEVDRLMADPRAEKTFDSFVTQWMRFDRLPNFAGLDKNVAFRKMAGADLPTAEFSGAIAEDALSAIRDLFRNGGSGNDLLTTRRSFVKNAALARIYGVMPWTGDGEPVLLGDERPGLLGRAYHLTSGRTTTSPILKGVFIRKELLCDDIPAPPANATDGADKIDPSLPVRQKVEILTSKGSCQVCHAALINGLGFASENFDALGRHRSEEVVFDENTGATLATLAVDTGSVPRVTQDDERPVADLIELAERIAASGKVSACLAKKATRFALGRTEDETTDGCALEATAKAFAEPEGFRKGWRSVVMNSAFRQRVFQ
jgi:Protein of unknown function (DUF1592)/Protein of unknown function (DUF1588)/Protein of unknown function (DUF1595)/Protein of unknown function (DUF1585)